MSAFPYTITVTMPDMASMQTNWSPSVDDLGGFGFEGNAQNDDTPPVVGSHEFMLSTVAIGGEINLNKIKFSGTGSYVTSGTYTDTSGGWYEIDFDVSITSDLLTIVIREVAALSSSPLPLRISTFPVSELSFSWNADNVSPWNGQAYAPVATISGGNNPTITKIQSAVSDVWSEGAGGALLAYKVTWEITDIGAIAGRRRQGTKIYCA